MPDLMTVGYAPEPMVTAADLRRDPVDSAFIHDHEEAVGQPYEPKWLAVAIVVVSILALAFIVVSDPPSGCLIDIRRMA